MTEGPSQGSHVTQGRMGTWTHKLLKSLSPHLETTMLGEELTEAGLWVQGEPVSDQALGGDSTNRENPLPSGRCHDGGLPSCPSAPAAFFSAKLPPTSCSAPRVNQTLSGGLCPYSSALTAAMSTSTLGSSAPQLGQPCSILTRDGAALSGFTLGCVCTQAWRVAVPSNKVNAQYQETATWRW